MAKINKNLKTKFPFFKSKFSKKKKGNSKLFATMQRFGGSLMVAVALLPAAGILLGLGTAFTNDGFINANGLSAKMGAGTTIYQIFTAFKVIGKIVFTLLPLLFAIGVSIGMSDKKKHIAAMSAIIGYIIFISTISSLLYIQNISAKTTSMDYLINFSGLSKGAASASHGSYVTLMGIFTLNMGIFGGIIVGMITAKINNMVFGYETNLDPKTKFGNVYKKTSGFVYTNALVVILNAIAMFLIGSLFWFIWPYIQKMIGLIGKGVSKSGLFGTFLYGSIERALVPFGLHHVFYLPFWQSEIGGTAVVGGQIVDGAQNIFFNEMFVGNIKHFNVEQSTRFMSGKFPIMMFGLPAAGFAMIFTIPKENRKVFGSIYLSAIATSFLTGITEPLEYTFLFVAPALFYGVHVILSGLSFFLMHLLNVGVGMTFSGGLIDFTLFGLMQGTAKTSWYWIPIVGLAFSPIYYFSWTYYIKKFKPGIPGMVIEKKQGIATSIKAPINIYETRKGVK